MSEGSVYMMKPTSRLTLIPRTTLGIVLIYVDVEKSTFLYTKSYEQYSMGYLIKLGELRQFLLEGT